LPSAADSPIRQLFSDFRYTNNTDPQTSGALDKLEAVADKHLENYLMPPKSVTPHKQVELGSQVEQHFQPLTALLKATAGGAAPLDQTIASLGQLYGYVIDLSNPSKKRRCGD